MYYSSRTHVLFRRDPREAPVLLSEPLYLKKLFFFHYLTIQNIFNYSLHIKIITKLCILYSHVVVLLVFGFGFPSVNSQNIFELFIHFYFFPTKIIKLYLLTQKKRIPKEKLSVPLY